MTMTTDTPRIYVACLAAYNNGHLHGKWIDADIGLEEVDAEVQEMLASSPIPNAEEYAIHDFEGFGSYRLSEYEGLTRVTEIADAIAEHGEKFLAYMSLGIEGADATIEEIADAMQERYQGEFETMTEYAEYVTGELGWNGVEPAELEKLSYYLDYEAIGRELEMDHDLTDGHVFACW